MSIHVQTQRTLGGLPVGELAPRWDWGMMQEMEHVVQFYETDEFLLQTLSEFIATGLSAGEAAIVVATRAHRDELDRLLMSGGLDLVAAHATGQYVALDAAEMLSTFMLDGSPEPARFVAGVGSIISDVASRSRVRIFGEMVALLWADGNYSAALQLEELWNQLHESHAFTLFCAYPMYGFDEVAHAQSLADVCVAHTRALPAESYTALHSPDDRLRAIVQLQHQARLLEAEIAERTRTEVELQGVQDTLEAQLAAHKQTLVREQKAREEAELANRLKDEFLGTVSHELRTPLTTIIGWSQRLRSGRLDVERVAHAIGVIEHSALAQAQLIEDILDVSRVITGKMRLDIQPVDAAAIINAAIGSMQVAADSKGLQLEVTIDPAACHITADANRLQQVVWNLLSNAIKFTPAGGRIAVRLERADANVQISVIDTGEGIPSDFLPFIFDQFRQADGTSTRRHGGLGLGLAIVRHLVELHGGAVQADSPGAGRGATFTIRLPGGVAPE